MSPRSLTDTTGPGRKPAGRRSAAHKAVVRARAAALLDSPPTGPQQLEPDHATSPWARRSVPAPPAAGPPTSAPPVPGPPVPGPPSSDALSSEAPTSEASDSGPAASLSRKDAIAAARAAVRRSRVVRGSVPPEPEPPLPPEQSTAPAPRSIPRRGRLALHERLPLWIQTRCAVEPRALVALVAVLLVAAGFAAYGWEDARPEPVRAPAVGAPPDPGPSPPPRRDDAGPRHVLVDVAGEVREPGVHRLPAGARVADALAAAGGVRPGTDMAALNRARVLNDGEHILVGITPPPGGVPGSVGAGPGPGPLSLNTATVEQLDTLPGIGPVLAQKIVDHRTEQGGFRSVDQLRDVGGIGDSRFAELESRVVP